MSGGPERVDAIVVGARCAGSAAAVALARSGRRVVALDRGRFPSDTLSTHLLWPSTVAELAALGVLPAVEALGAPRLPWALAGGAGVQLRGRFRPVDGIGHALCVRRPGMDAALVATARAAGAEVRERARVTGLVRDRDGRVAGVRWRHAGGDGGERELRAPLVIGADGRRSLVAREVGAEQPYRSSVSGRACYFGYWEDPHEGWRDTAAQWRDGPELGTAFPCDGGLVLALLQPPVARVAAFRADLEGEYRATIARIGPMAERLAGARLVGRVRSATGIASYFRRSAGPGWALAGDAGHFKDPVTAQGIRDALRYGRELGAAAAPLLDDPAALDPALRAWERRRERECLEVYQWTNGLARGEPLSPLEAELYRVAAQRPALVSDMLEVFSRQRRPSRVLSPPRAAMIAGRALLRRGARGAALHAAGRELAGAWADSRERARA
ncbi:NAD(P)/FAD-dependent oxidoreductase [Patulibacter defluvii]|uniref:NAD(P)/FAD-dependent oxidoreductase n=1 Tax=Patulibacter defluvii TaxID=3095358 RepID=UPI002A74F4D5|nr:FAD-dependent monooxygenase [Patulibacter sp. DM4]